MRVPFLPKKLSDDDIIRRGQGRRSAVLNLAALFGIVAFPFIFGGGFVAGALIGGGLAVTGSMGAAGFVSGLATGAVWGGLLTTVGLIGAAVGHRVLEERDEKRVDRQRGAYEAACNRKRAAQKAAMQENPKPLREKGAAAKAFARKPAVEASATLRPASPQLKIN